MIDPNKISEIFITYFTSFAYYKNEGIYFIIIKIIIKQSNNLTITAYIPYILTGNSQQKFKQVIKQHDKQYR